MILILNKRIKYFFTVILTFLVINVGYGAGTIDTKPASDIEDYSIQDLLNVTVTTASKKAEKSNIAPGVIEVITAQEIKAFGASNLMDIIQRASSIQPFSSCFWIQNFANFRGDRTLPSYDNHTLILLNGRPVRELISGGFNFPVYTAFPIDMIERIEIIRGPGSVLYGTNAFTGVINIITKASSKKIDTTLTLGVGSFAAITGSMTTGVINGDFKAKAGVFFNSDKGWNFSAWTPHPVFPLQKIEMKQDQRKLGFSADIEYKGLHISSFLSNFSDNSLGPIPYADRAGKNNGNRAFFDIGYTLKLSKNWTSDINWTLNYMDIQIMDQNRLYKPEDNSSWGYLSEISINGKISEKANIILGGDVDVRKNIFRPLSTIPKRYTQIHLTAYAQIDYTLFDNLTLIAGGQLNKPGKKSIDIVPRFGLIYNMKNGIGFKALYGKAFRSPWPLEQLINVPVALGNPDLEPEKIGTLDLQLFYQAKKASVALTYFKSHYTQMIIRTPIKPGVTTFVNYDNMKVSGLELEGKLNAFSNLLITGSAMYQDNKDPKTYAPHAMFKLGVYYHTSFGLNIGAFNTYFGKPLKNQGLALNPEAKAVSLLSLNLAYKLSTKVPIEITLYVRNVFNQNYYFTEFVRGWVNTLPMGSGRTIYSKITITF